MFQSLAMALFLIGCQDSTTPNGPSANQSSETPTQRAADSSDAQQPPGGTPAVGKGIFQDVTARTGIDFAYRNGREGEQYTLLETLGGGVAMIDYDSDGDMDLFFTGGGRISAKPVKITGLPPALYRNDGDWTFVDVTAQAGLDQPGDYSHGAFVADYDRDGHPDIFVTCYGRSRLYHNEGNGTFRDVTSESGLIIDGWSTAAAWADVDRDGYADLFVAGYVDWTPENSRAWCGDTASGRRDVCPPNLHKPAADHLFRSRGDGTFEEITSEAGLRSDGMGMGVVAADINRDGWIDLYVANDVARNFLYLGGPTLPFREVAETAGVAYSEYGEPEAGMGVDAGDFDGDGRLDVWVTNFEHEDNSLYQNDGNAAFTHRTVSARLNGPWRTLVGFGTGFVDFDSDGWLDLFVANGHVFYHNGRSPYLQTPLLFRNQDGMRFSNISLTAGSFFTATHPARGAAVGDLDNDGSSDLVVVLQNRTARLLRNTRQAQHWISLRLQGTTSNNNGVGATVTSLYRNRQLTRQVTSGAGYLSNFDSRLLLPIDAKRQEIDVVVSWPSGRHETFSNLSQHQTTTLIEGRGVELREQ